MMSGRKLGDGGIGIGKEGGELGFEGFMELCMDWVGG